MNFLNAAYEYIDYKHTHHNIYTFINLGKNTYRHTYAHAHALFYIHVYVYTYTYMLEDMSHTDYLHGIYV